MKEGRKELFFAGRDSGAQLPEILGNLKKERKGEGSEKHRKVPLLVDKLREKEGLE